MGPAHTLSHPTSVFLALPNLQGQATKPALHLHLELLLLLAGYIGPRIPQATSAVTLPEVLTLG